MLKIYFLSIKEPSTVASLWNVTERLLKNTSFSLIPRLTRVIWWQHMASSYFAGEWASENKWTDSVYIIYWIITNINGKSVWNITTASYGSHCYLSNFLRGSSTFQLNLRRFALLSNVLCKFIMTFRHFSGLEKRSTSFQLNRWYALEPAYEFFLHTTRRRRC